MISKRLAATITVRRGLAVQSFGYARWLPMGDPAVIAQTLDRWGADEIIVQVIDRAGQGPDTALLSRLNAMGLSTPLIYSGGLRNAADGVQAVKLGADRVCVDSLLRDDPRQVIGLSESLGAQAVIAALPLSLHGDTLHWRDYRRKTDAPLPDSLLDILASGRISEALLIDWANEGVPGQFEAGLVDRFPLPEMPLIAFGGLGEAGQMRDLLANRRVAAVAVGNRLSWREHAIQRLKVELPGLPLRPAGYSGREVPA